MNPSGGTITADHIGELILEKDKVVSAEDKNNLQGMKLKRKEKNI